jgi:hypothetical protein
MVVTFKGITRQMVGDWACAGIYKKDLSDSIGNFPSMDQVGENVIDYFEAPEEPGEYVIVLLSQWWQNGDFDDLLITSLAFTVGMSDTTVKQPDPIDSVAVPGSPGNEWIKLKRNVFKHGENVDFYVEGVTPQMLANRAWIGLYEKGAAHGDWYEDSRTYLRSDVDEHYHWFTLYYIEKGDFEIRLFGNDSEDYDKSFITAVSFSVGPDNLTYGNQWIKMEKDNFDPNESMMVAIFGVTQQMLDDWACIYFAKKGQPEWSLSGCPCVNEVGVSMIEYMNAPVEPGEYEIVLLSQWWQNGSFEELFITSVSFTVGRVAKAGNISLDKNAYIAMEPIIVTYSGITDQMVNAKAFVRIHDENGNTSYGAGYIKTVGSGVIEMYAPNENGKFEMRLYSVDDGNWNGTDEYLVMSEPFTVSGAVGSDWAQGEIGKANEYGLIPDCLRGIDLTARITRAEFAAVSVKVYEALSGETAAPAAVNPFTDTDDEETLKAYNVGITVGKSTDGKQFMPNDFLSRQEAATMLTRVVKKVTLEGWTMTTDSQFTLPYDKPAPFADDARIADWARDSVYFMAANKIILGFEDGTFRPTENPAVSEAITYGRATREQALLIAVRMVENLKEEP